MRRVSRQPLGWFASTALSNHALPELWRFVRVVTRNGHKDESDMIRFRFICSRKLQHSDLRTHTNSLKKNLLSHIRILSECGSESAEQSVCDHSLAHAL